MKIKNMLTHSPATEHVTKTKGNGQLTADMHVRSRLVCSHKSVYLGQQHRIKTKPTSQSFIHYSDSD